MDVKSMAACWVAATAVQGLIMCCQCVWWVFAHSCCALGALEHVGETVAAVPSLACSTSASCSNGSLRHDEGTDGVGSTQSKSWWLLHQRKVLGMDWTSSNTMRFGETVRSTSVLVLRPPASCWRWAATISCWVTSTRLVALCGSREHGRTHACQGGFERVLYVLQPGEGLAHCGAHWRCLRIV